MIVNLFIEELEELSSTRYTETIPKEKALISLTMKGETPMQCIITGHHLNVGEALTDHVEDRLETINEKYFNRAIESNVTFEKEGGHLFRAHISIRVGKDLLVQGSATEGDIYAAFDAAADKVAKQLRRYKRRIRDHHERLDDTPEAELQNARYTTLALDDLGDADDAANDETADAPEGEPAVIAEMTTNILTLSVSEAVMRLDLAEAPALMFRNSKNGEINMIYRRGDGNIGWIDPNWAVEQQDAPQQASA